MGRRLRRADRRHVRDRHLGRARAGSSGSTATAPASSLSITTTTAGGSRSPPSSRRSRRRCAPGELEIDGSACYDFLGYRYVPAPKTLYKRCFKLPPAHELVYSPDTGALSAPRRYWSLPVPDEPRAPPLEAACEELRSLDRRVGRRADDRRRAARLLPLRRRRLERRRRRGRRDRHARRHVLDRLRRRRSIRDAVRARGRAALRHGSSRAHPVASARAGAAAAAQGVVRRAVRRRVVDADVPRLLGGARARDGRADGRRRRRGLRRLSHLPALRALRALADLAGRGRARDLRAAPAVSAPPRRHARADVARDGIQRRPESLGQAHGRNVDAREARVRARARHPARLRRLVALSRALARRSAAAHAAPIRRLPHVHAGPRADEGRSHEHGRVARSARAAARRGASSSFHSAFTRTCVTTAASRKACCGRLIAASCPITFSTAARRDSVFRATT